MMILLQLENQTYSKILTTGKPLSIEEYRQLTQDFLMFQYPKFLYPPLAIYGDTHGSAKDMKHAINNKQFKLLLGDYVDRGPDGVICLQQAIALTVLQLGLAIRGNHEEFRINQRYGFDKQLMAAYKENYQEALDLTLKIYEKLKLFQLINSKFGIIMAVHGGVPLNQDLNSLVFLGANKFNKEDILWSDPGTQYRANQRGAGLEYDKKHFEKWSQKNGVWGVVRGHQVVQEGFRDDFGDQRHWTIFSSSSYVGSKNIGGWMLFDNQKGFQPQKIN
ncbi:Serine/threonine-protein phosphatase [Spironucleus salmonicida]|uniref:Serine/threonine-protein phosphatase n=1 Tax=Spironucleus salmonicida TaxID=348837 RepID=V6LHC3_9EUKA|nr:Serine/threonine-protein phosphatase [Spironucleus salmonicida]|eukprot:EST43683.1 Serine/threonine-protein phosphatase [Spironucleus salmonicida]